MHGVLCITLYDRHSEGVQPGPKPHLNASEEKELCNIVCDMGKIRYWKTRQQIKDVAEAVSKKKGSLRKNKIDGLGDSWAEIRCFFYTKETQLPLCE